MQHTFTRPRALWARSMARITPRLPDSRYAMASSSCSCSGRRPAPPTRGGTGGSRSTPSGLSSAATRLWRSRPQPRQRWSSTCSPFGRWKTPTGSIRERQPLARSPGRVSSTWREWRQRGQWLRCRPPETVGPMKARQRPHLNDSCPSARRCFRGAGVQGTTGALLRRGPRSVGRLERCRRCSSGSLWRLPSKSRSSVRKRGNGGSFRQHERHDWDGVLTENDTHGRSFLWMPAVRRRRVTVDGGGVTSLGRTGRSTRCRSNGRHGEAAAWPRIGPEGAGPRRATHDENARSGRRGAVGRDRLLAASSGRDTSSRGHDRGGRLRGGGSPNTPDWVPARGWG